jgi:hypothetical protein
MGALRGLDPALLNDALTFAAKRYVESVFFST